MNPKISVGQIFIDRDGDEVEVIRVGRNAVVLESRDKDLFVADADDVLQDIASGDLEIED